MILSFVFIENLSFSFSKSIACCMNTLKSLLINSFVTFSLLNGSIILGSIFNNNASFLDNVSNGGTTEYSNWILLDNSL